MKQFKIRFSGSHFGQKALLFWARNEAVILLVLAVLALLFPVAVKDPYVMNIAILAVIYAILSVSLNLLTGCLGIASIGHAAFMALGAYTATLLVMRLDASFPVAFLGAIVVTAIFGALLCIPTLRLNSRYLTIVTLAFCELVRIVLTNWQSLTRGPMGLPGIPDMQFFGYTFHGMTPNYYFALGLLVITIIIIHNLMNSSVGRAVTAIKNDPIAAEAMGVKTHMYKLLVFVVSSVLAGIAGAFYAFYIGFIDPSGFSFDTSVQILSMVIMGGLGNTYGSVFSAVILTALPEVLRPLLSLRQVLYGALLTAIVLLRPKGMLGGVNLKHIRQQNGITKKVRKERKK